MEMAAKKRFAKCIKLLRGDRSHEEFARAVGVSRPTIIGWEQCRSTPKHESLLMVAALRGETLDEFLAHLDGAKGKDPVDRILAQIPGLTRPQLAVVLHAVAESLEAV